MHCFLISVWGRHCSIALLLFKPSCTILFGFFMRFKLYYFFQLTLCLSLILFVYKFLLLLIHFLAYTCVYRVFWVCIRLVFNLWSLFCVFLYTCIVNPSARAEKHFGSNPVVFKRRYIDKGDLSHLHLCGDSSQSQTSDFFKSHINYQHLGATYAAVQTKCFREGLF